MLRLFLHLEYSLIANPLTLAKELNSAIKISALHQTLVKAKCNFSANAPHINATVKEAGCNFVRICMKLLHR